MAAVVEVEVAAVVEVEVAAVVAVVGTEAKVKARGVRGETTMTRVVARVEKAATRRSRHDGPLQGAVATLLVIHV